MKNDESASNGGASSCRILKPRVGIEPPSLLQTRKLLIPCVLVQKISDTRHRCAAFFLSFTWFRGRALHRAGTDLVDHVLNYWKNVGKRALAKSSLGRMVVQSSILNRRACGVRGNSK